MPDKSLERYHLERLRRCVAGIPEGEGELSEAPDFLFHQQGRRLGIEVTRFFLPTDGSCPQQMLDSLKERVLNVAERLHAARGGPALYVNAHFSPWVTLEKASVQGVAEALVRAVSAQTLPTSINEPGLEIPLEELPEEFASIEIHCSIDGSDKLWAAGSAEFAAPILPAHIEREIERKAPKAREARAKCDELWLVIVHDIFRCGAAAELTDKARDYPYAHPFDRLIWLEPHVPRALDLVNSSAALIPGC
jgi:hypothetical protein